MNHTSHVQHTSSLKVMVFEVIKTGTIIVIAVHIWILGGGGRPKETVVSIQFLLLLTPTGCKCLQVQCWTHAWMNSERMKSILSDL